jgi:V/A-type H+-transporting ATPase subunit E
MQTKLQELTDRLYKEGLSKGQEQAGQVLEAAKKEAAQLIEKAKETAAQLIADAKKTAEETKINAEGEVQLAARQAMANVKQAVESLVTTKVIAEPTKAAMSEVEFLKSLIKIAIERFDPKAVNIQLSVVLPADMQTSLQTFVDDQTKRELFKGIDFQFDKTFKSGFKIGPKNGGFHISLTDLDFQNLFGSSLRPHLRTLLFGK